MSNSLWPHELQHARPPCPSPTPRVHSDSRPLSQWCHPAISSSVVPFSSCPQSLPASESFPMSQLFAWGGQYWSFSVSIIPSKQIPGLIFRMDWLDLLAIQGTLKFSINWTLESFGLLKPITFLKKKKNQCHSVLRIGDRSISCFFCPWYTFLLLCKFHIDFKVSCLLM